MRKLRHYYVQKSNCIVYLLVLNTYKINWHHGDIYALWCMCNFCAQYAPSMLAMMSSYCEITSLGTTLSCLICISSLSAWYVPCCCFSLDFSSPVFVLLLLPVFRPSFQCLTVFFFFFLRAFLEISLCLKAKNKKLIKRENLTSKVTLWDLKSCCEIWSYNMRVKVTVGRYKITITFML